ncbi:MAG: DUF6263 family protein [Ginsengibacter sp.]
MKFNPAPNTVYHFTLTQFSIKRWTYQSKPVRVYDSVELDFSLQQEKKYDSLIYCKMAFNRFLWQAGKIHLNYKRGSIHALPIDVVLNDSGQVVNVGNVDKVIEDIEKDSATGKYLSGVIPDHISVSSITDMLNMVFSEIPARKVKANDTWVTDLTLNTNHPVHLSNFNVIKNRNGDTAAIAIQSNVFARRSPGDEFYINGKRKGIALVNYSTGIPYLYKTESDVTTTMSYYDVKEIKKVTLKLDSSSKRKIKN